jgi:hypothetical protein
MIALIFCLPSGSAQNSVSRPAPPAAVQRDRDSEQRLAGLIVSEIGKHGGKIPRIKQPTDFDLQMTCTAATDPSQTKNAEVYGLTILQAKVSELPSLLSSIAESEQSTKDEPGISIVAFRTMDGDGKEIVTLGLAKVESRISHIEGCLFTEDGCSDRTWQKSITPVCTSFRR